MDTAALRQRLGDILLEEERPIVDWEKVAQLCDVLLKDLQLHPNLSYPHIVAHYLDDADIRASDADYARGQRREIRRFVDLGECNDSKPVPGWAYIITLGIIGILLLWFFTP